MFFLSWHTREKQGKTCLKHILWACLFAYDWDRAYTRGIGLHQNVVLTNFIAELLGKPDEQSFGSADVAKAINVLVLNNFTHKRCTVFV